MTHSVLARFLLISLLAHAGALLLWRDVSSVPVSESVSADGPLQLALRPPSRDATPRDVARRTDAPSPAIESAARREEAARPVIVPPTPARDPARERTETGAVDVLIPDPEEERADRDAGIASDRAPAAEEAAVSSFAVVTEVGEAEVRARIGEAVETHFYYPPLARRHGWEGEVVVGVRVEGDGRLSAIDVVASSGYRVLDHAAVDSLTRLARLPDAGDLPASGIEVAVPVRYRLIDGPV